MFNFNYKINDEQVKAGELELSIFDLRIELKTTSKEDQLEPDAQAELEFRKGGFVVYAPGSDQQTLQDTFYNHYAEQLNSNIIKALNKYFYTTQPNKKNEFSFNLTFILGNCESQKKQIHWFFPIEGQQLSISNMLQFRQ